ncbi:MAG: family 43 glycosylhydrolase [Phycisphaerae bacterium]
MKKIVASILFVLVAGSLGLSAENPQAFNPFGYPLIPDMVADPSICEFDGVFYCYATTDGWGQGLASSGVPVVWKSEDFVNWSFEGSIYPDDFDLKYWAPSEAVLRDGKYYLFPTLDGRITISVSDSPEGPFTALDGSHQNREEGWDVYPIEQNHSIDAQIFIDDDDTPYMVWARRRAVKLKKDLTGPDGDMVTFATKRGGYSEGPFLFKRGEIYYYLYTLSGHESYQYAYMMSKVGPLGPWEAPEEDIIARSSAEGGVEGPGHGCFFSPEGSEKWYFVFLEYGRSATTRQIYASEMEFYDDGTIMPINVTNKGVGALGPLTITDENIALKAEASAASEMADYKVPPRTNPQLDRTETYAAQNAIDGSNGTRWMAAYGASSAFVVDFGEPQNIKRSDIYFVKPTAGHAYKLESSLDGENWALCGGHKDVIKKSPHSDAINAKVRYLRVKILAGERGIWEFKAY